MADNLLGAFRMELADLEVAAVEVDASLHVTPVPGSQCLRLDRLLTAGTTEASPIPCDSAFHCDLAATASSRHPD
jgi:hypothetical protein